MRICTARYDCHTRPKLWKKKWMVTYLHVTVNFKDSYDLRHGHQSYQWNQCKRDMDGLKHIEPLV
jgi:hypothetical protein